MLKHREHGFDLYGKDSALEYVSVDVTLGKGMVLVKQDITVLGVMLKFDHEVFEDVRDILSFGVLWVKGRLFLNYLVYNVLIEFDLPFFIKLVFAE